MTKGELVAEALKKEIASGRIKPGDKLPSEAELCSLYNVSRTSVRSAIHTLAAEGAINTYHGKGSFVSKDIAFNRSWLDFSNMRVSRIDMFEFRRMFETETAALAAARADEDIVERLKDNVAEMQRSGSPQDAVDRDTEFHYLIAEATKNSVMTEVFNMLRPTYRRMFFENVAIRGNDGYKEHLQIISAIESRNPEAARKYMAEHLNNSMMQNTVAIYMNSENQ